MLLSDPTSTSRMRPALRVDRQCSARTSPDGADARTINQPADEAEEAALKQCNAMRASDAGTEQTHTYIRVSCFPFMDDDFRTRHGGWLGFQTGFKLVIADSPT